MATITEVQAKNNREIINKLLKVLGIDNIEQVRDFSIHVRHNFVIETEVSFWNTEYQIEKIMKVFKSGATSEAQKKLDKKIGSFIKASERLSNGEKVKTGDGKKRTTYANLPTAHELRKVLYHDRLYNNIYCRAFRSKFDSEGIVVRCSGDLIMGAFINSNEGAPEDLVLENLQGIKEVIVHVAEPTATEIKEGSEKVVYGKGESTAVGQQQ